jgi:hypothetical protein
VIAQSALNRGEKVIKVNKGALVVSFMFFMSHKTKIRMYGLLLQHQWQQELGCEGGAAGCVS